jgi:hypothetical protein
MGGLNEVVADAVGQRSHQRIGDTGGGATLAVAMYAACAAAEVCSILIGARSAELAQNTAPPPTEALEVI